MIRKPVKRVGQLLPAVILLVLLATSTSAISMTIKGKVGYEGQSNPVKYASVELWEDLETNVLLQEGKQTNQSGEYAFDPIEVNTSRNFYIIVYTQAIDGSKNIFDIENAGGISIVNAMAYGGCKAISMIVEKP